METAFNGYRWGFCAKLAKVVVSHTFHRIMGLDDS